MSAVRNSGQQPNSDRISLVLISDSMWRARAHLHHSEYGPSRGPRRRRSCRRPEHLQNVARNEGHVACSILGFVAAGNGRFRAAAGERPSSRTVSTTSSPTTRTCATKCWAPCARWRAAAWCASRSGRTRSSTQTTSGCTAPAARAAGGPTSVALAATRRSTCRPTAA